MSDKQKDGGAAFPNTGATNAWGSDILYPELGMTLRDWFAGQALGGQLAFSPHDSFQKAHLPDDVAKLCYEFADAMLKAREPK